MIRLLLHKKPLSPWRVLLPRLLSGGLTVLLASLLAYTASKKLMSLITFSAHLELIPLLSDTVIGSKYLALGVALTELLLALGLLYPHTRKAACYLLLIALSVYTGYVYYILNHAAFVPCSCEGAFKSLSWQGHYWINVGASIAVGCILWTTHRAPHHIHKKNERHVH